MNDSIFRRDRSYGFVSPAAQRPAQVLDASRAFVPEPPAAMPLGPLDHVPVQPVRAGGGGDSLTDVGYAAALVKTWGITRAMKIATAEGRLSAARLLAAAITTAWSNAEALDGFRSQGLL